MAKMTPLEIAVRHRFSYANGSGSLSLHQVWQLPLMSVHGVSLNSVALILDDEIRQLSGTSFVKTKVEDPYLECMKIKMTVLKRIIEIREYEAELEESAEARRKKVAQLESALAQAEAKDLASLTPDQIRAQLAAFADG